MIAAALGLAAVVAASATAFAVIKLAGAVYLIYLGLLALRSAHRSRESVGTAEDATDVPGHAPFLGLLFNALGVVWLTSYAVAAARGRNVLNRPAVKRALERVTGVVLIGLGARLALESRP